MLTKAGIVGQLMAGCEICGQTHDIVVLEPNVTVRRYSTHVLCGGHNAGWETSHRQVFWDWLMVAKYQYKKRTA